MSCSVRVIRGARGDSLGACDATIQEEKEVKKRGVIDRMKGRQGKHLNTLMVTLLMFSS